jgi:uncharacterized membrane protein YbhN (UPF0104 family)/tRNA A-37 threonylcarbamoyl transferase component Bud32
VADASPNARFFVRGSNLGRRPIDAILLALGILVALACVQAAERRGVLDDAVRHVADDLPRWVTALFDGAYTLGAAYAVVVVVAVLVTLPRRGMLPLTLLVAVGVAIAGTFVASWLAGAGWPDLDPGPVRSGSPHGFPTVRVAIVTALLLTLRPWVVLAYRRFHILIVALQCFAAWAIGIAGPTDVLGALALGIAGAGAALVLFGSPAGHPDLQRVSASLQALGLDVTGLRFAERQPWGARILYADATDGSPLLVKVYGRDATDAHRASRWWRMLLYRDQTAPGATRLQLVEHEALVTILAERAGTHVADVIASAETDGDAVLVLGAPGPSLGEDAELDDTTLTAVWTAVGRLHAAGLTHGELTLDQISRAGADVLLSDFSSGAIAAEPAQRSQEVATLLISQAEKVGAARAVASAISVLGDDTVLAAQPYLQRAALPKTLRAADGLKGTITAVVAAITDQTGAAPLPPAEIVRIRWRDLLQTALIVLAAYGLLSMLIDLDWETVIDTWRNAAWGWVALALVVAQLTSVADAGTAMSTVRTRLPLGPLVQLQYGVKTIGLAISATLGRVALYTTFLRRYGEGPATAVTATALDSVAGTVANVVVVLVALLVASSMPELDLSGPDNLDRILLYIAIAVILSVIAIVVVPKLRHYAVTAVRSAWDSLRVVTESPGRALGLFGTNLASLMITAVSLAFMVKGLQPSISYGTALFVTAAAAAFAAIIPVPGNVGVAEAAIAAGLVAVGMDSGPAFAVAVTQRMATSYLPPVYGVWALRWLRKQDYID